MFYSLLLFRFDNQLKFKDTNLLKFFTIQLALEKVIEQI